VSCYYLTNVKAGVSKEFIARTNSNDTLQYLYNNIILCYNICEIRHSADKNTANLRTCTNINTNTDVYA